MSFVYIISVLFLMISFIFFEKEKSEISIISSVIYTLCLLFCEQVVMVCILSFFKLGGSLLYYSIFQCLVGTILFFISYQRRRVQTYFFDKKELFLVMCVIVTVFLVAFYRFRGFSTLSYISDDSSIHYRAAKIFSDQLVVLTENNHHDLIYNFTKMMPMFYINCGIFLKLFSFISSYKLFMIHDTICLILYSLLFLVTIKNNLVTIKKNKDWGIYLYIATILYVLAYPLNNMLFGFCYLGFGIMIINLLIYTMNFIHDDFESNCIMNLFLLFMLNFSLFYSYYLFMPFIYLGLGIYYIILWKRKKISFTICMLYGFLTLIFPFILGFIRFMLPGLFSPKTNFVTYITLNGDIYSNIAPMYLFIFTTAYLVYDKIEHKKKISFFLLMFYLLTGYVFIFLILYIFKISATYYFYKLFYIYWLFFSIYVVNNLIYNKKIIYIFTAVIVISIGIVMMFPYSKITYTLDKSTIYTYNARKFGDDWIRLTNGELKLIDAAFKYRDICELDHKFPITGRTTRNSWFYSITGSVPNINFQKKDTNELYVTNISFEEWKASEYKCILYFSRDSFTLYDSSEYESLYQNDGGALLMKK